MSISTSRSWNFFLGRISIIFLVLFLIIRLEISVYNIHGNELINVFRVFKILKPGAFIEWSDYKALDFITDKDLIKKI